ncbi:hypothetical protein Landi51_10713 [Colletotrichum acutatum]
MGISATSHWMSDRPYSLNNGDPFVKVDEGELVYTPTPPSRPRLVTPKGSYALHESIKASKGEEKGLSAYASWANLRMKAPNVKPV